MAPNALDLHWEEEDGPALFWAREEIDSLDLEDQLDFLLNGENLGDD